MINPDYLYVKQIKIQVWPDGDPVNRLAYNIDNELEIGDTNSVVLKCKRCEPKAQINMH